MAANSSFSYSGFQIYSNSLGMLSMSMAFIATKLFLILPLCLCVLHIGVQRWRQQRSFTSASHSDVFTYHLVVVELMYLLGVVINSCGLFLCVVQLTMAGLFLCIVASPVVTCFNILTCVERYLAVVHPVVYLGLKQSGGVRIRNVSIACVWLLCFIWVGVITFYTTVSPFTSYFCFLAFALVVVSFCSVAVLYVLIRPGPGETDKGRAQVDQSKLRAFHTVTAILGVLLLCFLGYLITIALVSSHVLTGTDETLLLMSGYWWSLPSSLVLPVLFLQRAGKLVCCQH